MVDEYGEGLYPDLLFYYDIDLIDVIEGRGPAPSLALSLVQRLPEESMTMALVAGGRQFFGWNTDRYLLADLYDAINVNTKATGNWKNGKAPKMDPWPRPKKDSKPSEKRRVTVADLHARMNTRR